jgi:hypothetical protein
MRGIVLQLAPFVYASTDGLDQIWARSDPTSDVGQVGEIPLEPGQGPLKGPGRDQGPLHVQQVRWGERHATPGYLDLWTDVTRAAHGDLRMILQQRASLGRRLQAFLDLLEERAGG